MTEKPVASEYTRPRRVRLPRPARHYDGEHQDGGVVLDAGKFVELSAAETIRTGYCRAHGRSSTEFIAPNEHGWIFWCQGSRDKSISDPVAVAGHYFTNSPPSAD